MAKKKPEANEAAQVPTVDEAVAAGYSLREAHGVVAEAQALADGKASEDAAAAREAALAAFDAPSVETPVAEKPAAVVVEAVAPVPRAPKPPPGPSLKKQVYEVCSARPQGFWRIGRKFGLDPVLVDPEALTPEQLRSLLETDKRFLKVKLVDAD